MEFDYVRVSKLLNNNHEGESYRRNVIKVVVDMARANGKSTLEATGGGKVSRGIKYI